MPNSRHVYMVFSPRSLSYFRSTPEGRLRKYIKTTEPCGELKRFYAAGEAKQWLNAARGWGCRTATPRILRLATC